MELNQILTNRKMLFAKPHLTNIFPVCLNPSLQKRAKGQYLFFKVCEHLNLMEKDYFGLAYVDNHEQTVCICVHAVWTH